MIILCIISFKNVRHIRSIPRQKRGQIRSMTKKDFQLLRCLFVQDIIFIIFGSTITAYYLYYAITADQIHTQLQQVINTFVNSLLTFLYDVSYSTNFFVFLIVSKAFRHELKRMFYKIVGQNLLPIREEENKQENRAINNPELNVVSTIELPA